MMKLPHIRADLTRWASGGLLTSIVKWGPLLITPVVLLYSYATVQSVKRESAEQKVAQLTHQAERLRTALAQIERYEKQRQDRDREYTTKIQTLASERGEVLELSLPDSVVDLLRPDAQAGTSTDDP